MSSPSSGLSYYTGLISSEYQDSPQFLAWLAANLQLFQDVNNCLNTFSTSFDIQQAVGAQLDVLGVIIGQSRTVAFQPSNGVSPILDDGTYRLLLQARVAQYHWEGTTTELRGVWNGLFPGGILLVTDHQDMTVTFYVAGAFTSVIQDLITHGYIIPRPQGVLYIITIATLPLLGFDLDTPYVAGFALEAFQTPATLNGTSTIVVASAAGIVVGQTVYGSGIPLITTVSSISGTSIVLSNAATISASGVQITFYVTDASGHLA